MHREEFTNTLIEDEFISALIAQIKTIAKQLKIEEINLLISQIEEDLHSKRKEMSRFTEFLIEQLKSFIQSDFEEEEEEKSPERIINGNTNCTSNENSSSSKHVKEDIGIDELVEYIEKREEKKTKKNKKKHKKNKKEKIIIGSESIDNEVENFKKIIYEESLNSRLIRKIRPQISEEWILNLSKFISI
jgi:hypothetical protein